MFAPHCPTCDRRVLLGPGRIVHTGRPGVLLRCFCGDIVAWDQDPPAPEASHELASVPAGP